MWLLPKLSPGDILIYLRKSRTDDPSMTVDEVLSKHEQMLDDWTERNLTGGRIPESNRYREVVSGETIASRPQVQQLLRCIESPRVKAVLIVEPQRLSRGDLEDIGRLVKLLRYTNTLVITLQYTYDLSDERDRDMFERELKRGNEFLEYQKRIMGNGRLLSVQNGNFIGQTAPYGYRKIVIREGKRKCHTLEPIPEEAAIVKQVFEMYARGENSSQISRALNAMSIPSPSGKQWTPSSIKPMLTNDHYIGMVHWNRRKSVRIIEDGELLITRPRSTDYMIYPGKHPAIIDQELWDAVQDIRGKLPPVKPKAKHTNPFAGLVRCQCGGNMYRQSYIRNGVSRSAPRLTCINQASCGNASCSEAELTDEIVNILRQAISDTELDISDGKEAQIHAQQQLIAQLEKKLDALDTQELSLWDKYTQEQMPKHIFDSLREKITQERTSAHQALSDARTSIPDPVDYQSRIRTLHAAIDLLLDPDAPVKQKNLLLKKCIEQVTYSRAKKASNNPRFGTPEPMVLDVHLRI